MPEPRPSARPSAMTAFARDLAALRAELVAAIGPEDLRHLRKLERWGRGCAALGLATAWIAPNPLSVLLIAHASTVRWTIVMHHVGHGGYDRVAGAPTRYRSRRFAAGWRRLVDYLDWIDPVAWRWEHNLHHARTSDPGDPDLVQRNVDWLRRAALPRPLKLVLLLAIAATWKLVYYASNTFQRHRGGRERPRERHADRVTDLRYLAAFNLFTAEGRAFWWRCVLPYGLVRFVVVPALFIPLGVWVAVSALINIVLAEILGNLVSFVLVTSNHAGDDLVAFDGRPGGQAEFLWRQVAGTVNYRAGGDLMTFLHGGLNLHIEHHLWPDLPLLKCMQAQPRLRAICAAHGVAYREEGALRRARRAVAVMIGDAANAGA